MGMFDNFFRRNKKMAEGPTGESLNRNVNGGMGVTEPNELTPEQTEAAKEGIRENGERAEAFAEEYARENPDKVTLVHNDGELSEDQLATIQGGYPSENPDEREMFVEGQREAVSALGSDDPYAARARENASRASLARRYVEMGGPEDYKTLNAYLNGELTDEDLAKIVTYGGTKVDGSRSDFTDEHIEQQRDAVDSMGTR